MRKLIIFLIIFSALIFVYGFNWPWSGATKNKTIEITLAESGGPYNLNNKIEIKKDLQAIYYISQSQNNGFWGIIFNKNLPENEYNGRFIILNFKPADKKVSLAIPITSYEITSFERL